MSGLDDAVREVVRAEVRAEVRDAIRDLLLPMLSGQTSTPDRLLTLAEAQEVLGAGWDTVNRLLRAGELEAVQVRGHRKVTAASLTAYMDRNRLPASRPRAVS